MRKTWQEPDTFKPYRTLMSLYGPKVFKTCFPAMPMEQRPCRIGRSNPPMAANSGKIWTELHEQGLIHVENSFAQPTWRGLVSPLNLFWFGMWYELNCALKSKSWNGGLPIQCSLRSRRLFLHDGIRMALWWGVGRGRSTAIWNGMRSKIQNRLKDSR